MNIKEKVKKLLEQSKYLSDDRNELIQTILVMEGLSTEEARLCRKHFQVMVNADRYFRKIQQDYPELRGSKWEERQYVKTVEKQRELGYNA